MSDDLKQAVEGLHNCKASLRVTDMITDMSRGEVVWKGEVSTFTLKGHPKARICYAWSSPIEGSDKRKFYAVLKLPPIKSPIDAVRAAIIRDQKSG